MAAAAFMMRDGGMPGNNISIYEAAPVLGGSLDGAGNPEDGYSMRGGRMLTTDNYECTWGLFKSIPSLADPKNSLRRNHRIQRAGQGALTRPTRG